jgi:hypothetical protein
VSAVGRTGRGEANIRPLLAAVTIQRFTIQRAERPNVWIRPQFPHLITVWRSPLFHEGDIFGLCLSLFWGAPTEI